MLLNDSEVGVGQVWGAALQGTCSSRDAQEVSGREWVGGWVGRGALASDWCSDQLIWRDATQRCSMLCSAHATVGSCWKTPIMQHPDAE
jgi:hypothetical protein